MQPYKAKFPIGSKVRISEQAELELFRREWKYHNPITPDQLGFAGKVATIEDVGFYHGGDPLYKLDTAPGVWHEECLTEA